MRAVKLLSAVFLCLSLCSCSSVSCDTELPLGPFICEISWESGGETFTASFTAGAIVNGRRDYVMRILSPSAVSELRVVSSGGAAQLYRNDLCIGPAPRGYTDTAHTLLPMASLDYLCKTKLNGVEALCYISDGVRWYFSSATGKPIRAENDRVTLDIRRIERS